MSRSIKLSEKHGVNPSMQVCFWCGEVIGVALMGRLKGDVEAPREVVLDYSLCDKCKEKEKTYIHLIECTGEDNGNPPIAKDAYPTGRNMWIKDAALRSIITEDSFNEIKEKRAALMLPETFEAFIKIYEDAQKEGDASSMLDEEGTVKAEETAEAETSNDRDDVSEKAENIKGETEKEANDGIVVGSVFPVTARKNWKCSECGHNIMAYSQFERRRVRRGGKVEVLRICKDCHEKYVNKLSDEQ